MISAGSPAPDFALYRKIGEPPFRLSSRFGRGPTVLLFFPLAFSGKCTDELCAVAEDYGAWESLETTVVGISVDSAFVNHRFAEALEAPFPILSDFNKTTAAAYGVLDEDYFGMHGVASRSAFVVDTDGVVRYAWITDENDALPDLAAIRAAVEGLG